jgi:hypothetical protein
MRRMGTTEKAGSAMTDGRRSTKISCQASSDRFSTAQPLEVSDRLNGCHGLGGTPGRALVASYGMKMSREVNQHTTKMVPLESHLFVDDGHDERCVLMRCNALTRDLVFA